MPDKSVYSWTNIGLAIGGGLAGAAVFAVLSKGMLAALLLAHLSPLPIMIVALSLGVGHGATAALIGTAALTIWPHPLFGMAYGLLVALPAWAGCYAIAGAPFRRRDLLSSRLPAWAVLAMAVIVAGAMALFLAIAALSHGEIEEPLAYLQGRFFFALDAMQKAHQLEGVTTEDITRFTQLMLPASLASYAALLLSLNLWIAGRLVKASGVLTLPWPDIARDFALPRAVAVIFILSAALSVVPGFPGQAALIVLATLGLALGFQGLAVTHFYLRGSKSSVLVLSIIYFMLGVLGFPMILFTLLGLLDAALNLRERKGASASKEMSSR